MADGSREKNAEDTNVSFYYLICRQATNFHLLKGRPLFGFRYPKKHPNFGRSSEMRGRGELLLLGVVSSPEGILLKIHPSIVSSRWVNFSFAGKNPNGSSEVFVFSSLPGLFAAPPPRLFFFCLCCTHSTPLNGHPCNHPIPLRNFPMIAPRT